MITRSGSFIDGVWHESKNSETVSIIDPHSEALFAKVAVSDIEQVDAAVESAQRALDGDWSRTPLEERVAIVQRICDLLYARKDELADYSTHSMGAPYQIARYLGGSAELIDMYVDSIRKIKLDFVRNDRYGNSLVSRKPVGVVAAIVPWNAPVRSEIKKVIPALLAGCSVVLKPAPETPLGAAVLAEICVQAGLPAGALNVVFGAGSVGEALIQHRGVRKIAFTGSTATGTRIASLAGAQSKRVQLELGGKSAAILLDDVDLTSAMPVLAMTAWANSGQACVANTRVLAPRSRYDEVVDAYVAAASAEVVGDPMDPATTLGPLVSHRQVERVMSYIGQGLSQGARLVAGGGRPDGVGTGFYVRPTVFADVDNKMTIAQEEIFGPVTAIIPYDSDAEAVAIANDSDYGLAGSVMGVDEDRALEIARQIDSGSVAVNGFYPPASSPFGGVKLSGVGREHGPEGYDAFLEYASYRLTPGLAARLSRELPPG